jgi:hypothetical protein
MIDASMPSLLEDDRPGRLRLFAGRLMSVLYAADGQRRYDDFRLERVRSSQPRSMRVWSVHGRACSTWARAPAFVPCSRRAMHGA